MQLDAVDSAFSLGTARASRAHFGASPKGSGRAKRVPAFLKVRNDEDAIASTRGARVLPRDYAVRTSLAA
jgi:hypothetical protein